MKKMIFLIGSCTLFALLDCTAQSTTQTIKVNGKNKGTSIIEKTSGSGMNQIKIKEISIDCDNLYDMTCYTITTTTTGSGSEYAPVVVENEFGVPIGSGGLFDYKVYNSDAETTSVISLTQN